MRAPARWLLRPCARHSRRRGSPSACKRRRQTAVSGPNGRPFTRPAWPALDKLDYIYRAVTPPGLPRRFNARFFLARADDASGTLDGNGELLDLGWVTVTEAMGLPIPYITAVVLEELEHMYASPPDPDSDRPVPVCIRVGRDHVHGHE